MNTQVAVGYANACASGRVGGQAEAPSETRTQGQAGTKVGWVGGRAYKLAGARVYAWVGT